MVTRSSDTALGMARSAGRPRPAPDGCTARPGAAAPSAARPMRIAQFYTGPLGDAVADSLLFTRSLLAGWQVQSDIFTAGPPLGDTVLPVAELAAQAPDLLLIHLSGSGAGLPELNDVPCCKALVCHDGGMPPADALPIVEAAIAVSSAAAHDLQEHGFPNAAVIPLLKDFAAMRSAPHETAHYHDEAAVFRLLSAGGIRPDRGLEDSLALVAAARSIDGVPIELVLIGDRADDAAFCRRLDARVRELGIERQVRMIGAVADGELFGHYRSATACLSLSDQPGLDVSLLEAMAFDRPVVAYRSAAAVETLADAGITVEGGGICAILEALQRLHRDRAFRRDVIRAQRSRLLRFSREHVAQELAAWLGGLGIRVGVTAPSGAGAKPVHYVIEGPFESSYSLASVNRNLAASLEARGDCAGHIEPAEGDAGYCVDTEAAARLPRAVTELVRPAPLAAQRIVTIRNMFPCRPNGMLGDLRLVHLAWEESAIAAGLASLMNQHLDGVLVPSEYCKRVVRDSGVSLPIAVIGHGVDHEGVPPPLPIDRATRGEPTREAPFVFLNVSAGVDRKGVEELVTAYALAFSRRDPVLLVIKTYENEQNLVDRWVSRVTQGVPDAPVIQVIFDELHRQEIEMLYGRADVLVLPTRGEGFNLPAAEAMARGLPVIVTRHSGHLDFCNDANCLLVDCHYEISTSYLRIPDSVWVRPAVQQLVTALKAAYREARTAGSATHSRALRAPPSVADMRWGGVAERVDRFARSLEDRPAVTRQLRLAWVTPDGSGDAVADSAACLLERFDRALFDITSFAADRQLATMRDELPSGHFDAVFLHHDSSLFDTAAVTDLLRRLQQTGIDTYVMLPAWTDARNREDAAQRSLAAALTLCTRVFLHHVDDMNRLKSLMPADTVVLLPYGVIDGPQLPMAEARARIGLERFDPVIGAPGAAAADLQPLLQGFLLLLRRRPQAFLLIVDDALPEAERRRLAADIDALGLAARVRLSECRDRDEMISQLSACSCLVYLGRYAGGAIPAALGRGLASGRPVAVPPFRGPDELSDVVYALPAAGGFEIAEGLAALLDDEHMRGELARRQRGWLDRHGWSAQAERIGNIVRGCCEERLGIELRPPQTAMTSRIDRRTEPARQLLAAARAPVPAPDPPAEAAVEPTRIVAPGGHHPGLLRDYARKRAVRRANRARDAHDWIGAARYYRLALDYRPERSGIWVQYGHALKESGNFSAAEAAYRHALSLAPTADSHLQLGHVLKMQGHLRAAASAYLEALRADPHFAPALSELNALGWGSLQIGRALLGADPLPVSAAPPAEPDAARPPRLPARDAAKSGHISFPRFLAQWRELAVDVPPACLRTDYAVLTSAGVLRADRHPGGIFCYGPHFNLPAGRYRVQAIGNAGDGAEYRVQMVRRPEGRPAEVVCERSYSRCAAVSGTLAELACECETELRNLEIVVKVISPEAEFCLASIRISADRLRAPG
jgi:glycosyltransferase involved in cell wall biosynthesis